MIKYAFVTNNGLVHPNNEDSITLFNKSISNTNLKKHGTKLFLKNTIFGVFDGVGGNEKGNVASDVSAKYLATRLVKQETLDYKELVNLSLKINNNLRREQSKQNCPSMMSTMVMAIIKDGKCAMMNVGDSRGYIIDSGNNKIIQKSYDDTYRNKLIAEGQLSMEEINNMDTAHYITNCLGMPDFNQNLTHSFIFDIKKHDKILLMSDGVSDLVNDEEMLNIFKANNKLENIVDEIEKLVLQRGAHDNYTLLIMEA